MVIIGWIIVLQNVYCSSNHSYAVRYIAFDATLRLGAGIRHVLFQSDSSL